MDRALQVAESGARVIATARSIQKAPGLQALARTHDRDTLQVVALDVTDAASLRVRDCFASDRRCGMLLRGVPAECADVYHGAGGRLHRASCGACV